MTPNASIGHVRSSDLTDWFMGDETDLNHMLNHRPSKSPHLNPTKIFGKSWTDVRQCSLSTPNKTLAKE